jgi:hypothetical protein
MKLAYADPPYPGCAHLYADHPDYAGEVDHVALIHRLHEEYDGWALSTSSKALQDILAICPGPGVVRVLVWVKNSIRYSWEPVIVASARPVADDQTLRDWIHVEPEGFQYRPKPESYVIGQKPQPFAMWLFDWLGAHPEDSFDDLFPGSGAVGLAWETFQRQIRLPAIRPNTRAMKRDIRRGLKEHPVLDA